MMTANTLSRQLLGAACQTLFCGLAAAKDNITWAVTHFPPFQMRTELCEGKNICTPRIFKNAAREKIWEFSKPALLRLDNRRVRLFYPQMLTDAR